MGQERKICPFMSPGDSLDRCLQDECALYIIDTGTQKAECAIVKAARMADILARRGEDR